MALAGLEGMRLGKMLCVRAVKRGSVRRTFWSKKKKSVVVAGGIWTGKLVVLGITPEVTAP